MDAPTENPAPAVARRPVNWRRRLAFAWVGVTAPLTALLLYAHFQLLPGVLYLQRMNSSDPQSQYAGQDFDEREQTETIAGDQVRMRIYLPRHDRRRTVMFVTGLHPKGIDEPRFVAVCRKLAGVGIAVVAPHLDALVGAHVEPDEVLRIEAAGAWLLEQRDLVPEGERIGLMGICYGGGLTLVAARRETLRDRLAFTFAIGPHCHMPQAMRFLVTGKTHQGKPQPVDAFGMAIVMKHITDGLIPDDQLDAFNGMVSRFTRDGKESALHHLHELPEPSRGLMKMAIEGDTEGLGPVLVPPIEALPDNPMLSPILGPPPACPVYILHSKGDKIVPAEQTLRLAEAWRAQGGEVHALVTPLFDHVDLKEGMWREKLKLVRFISAMLRS